MFVTEEERVNYGGFFGLYVPMMLIGGAAALSLWQVFSGTLPVPGGKIMAVAAAVFFVSLGFYWRIRQWLRALVAALITTAILTASLNLLSQSPGRLDMDNMEIVWMSLASWFALLVFFGASLDERRANWLYPPAYRTLFARALSLPPMLLILALLLGLFTVFMTAMFKLGAPFAEEVIARNARVVEESTRPLLASALTGVFLGLATAFVRSQQVLLGAVRFAILFAARYLMPVMAVISLMLVISLALNGTLAGFSDVQAAPVFPWVAAGLILNIWLVYQNGEGGRPGWWLRLSVAAGVIALAALLKPFFADLLNGGSLQRSDYWHLFLVTAGSATILGGLSGLIPVGKRWMPLMAVFWMLLLLAIAAAPLVTGLAMLL